MTIAAATAATIIITDVMSVSSSTVSASAFVVLSAFVVKSGLSDYFGKFLSPVTKRLFHTNGTVGAIILLGLNLITSSISVVMS